MNKHELSSYKIILHNFYKPLLFLSYYGKLERIL